jgi:hypothetical protein
MATWSVPVSASTGPLRRLRRLLPYLGRLVSVGYMDRALATDIEGGAQSATLARVRCWLT